MGKLEHRKHLPRRCYIYAVQAIIAPIESVIKIGQTTGLAGRMSTYRVSSPVPVKMIYATILERREALMVERTIHKLLAEHRSHGEWFYVSHDNAVTTIRSALNIHNLAEELAIQLPV